MAGVDQAADIADGTWNNWNKDDPRNVTGQEIGNEVDIMNTFYDIIEKLSAQHRVILEDINDLFLTFVSRNITLGGKDVTFQSLLSKSDNIAHTNSYIKLLDAILQRDGKKNVAQYHEQFKSLSDTIGPKDPIHSYKTYAGFAKGMFDDRKITTGRLVALTLFSYELIREKIFKTEEDPNKIYKYVTSFFLTFLEEDGIVEWMINQNKNSNEVDVLDTPEFIDYYKKALREGKKKVSRVRVMIVGHYGAGKTSLKKRLLDQGFSYSHNKTDGIETDPSACVVDVTDSVLWKTRSKGYKPGVGDDDPGVLYREGIAQATLEFMSEGSSVDPPQYSKTMRSVDTVDRHRVTTLGLVNNRSARSSLDNLDSQESSQESVFPQSSTPVTTIPPDIKDLIKELRDKVDDEQQGRHNSGPGYDETDHLSPMARPRGKSVSLADSVPKLKLSFWDFGGQRVFYTTHQTFLTNRAIYILVLDLTKGLDDPVETMRRDTSFEPRPDYTAPEKVKDYLDYWLNSIHTHARKNDHVDDLHLLNPPVIIVCTHKDDVDKEYHQSLPFWTRATAYFQRKQYYNPDLLSKHIQEYYSRIADHLYGKKYHKHVYGRNFAVDNRHEGDPEILKLREAIVNLAQEQNFFGEEIPIRWFKLEKKLNEWRLEDAKEQRKFVALCHVNELAKKVEIKMTTREVKAFLLFYHSVGDLIFFDEDKLRDFVILDPQWLIDAFKSIITLEEFHKQPSGHGSLSREYWQILDKHGILHEELVTLIWEDDVTLINNKAVILDLMQKFDLICLLKHQKNAFVKEPDQIKWTFFVPCLLPKSGEKDIVPSRDIDLPPLFYCMDFLPHGLYHHLVARMCQNPKWRLYLDTVFYDYARFEIDEDGTHVLTVRREETYIELKVHVLVQRSRHTHLLCKGAREEFQAMLQASIKKYCPRLDFHVCIQCGHDPSVLIKTGVTENCFTDSDHTLMCKEHFRQVSPDVIDGHKIWYEPPSMKKKSGYAPSQDKPTPQSVGNNQPISDDDSDFEDEEAVMQDIKVNNATEEFFQFWTKHKRVYKNLSRRRGRAVIINNDEFARARSKQINLGDRKGSREDVKNLENLFDQLSYKTVIHHNLGAWQIKETLMEESHRTDHNDFDSFILIFLSHGAEGRVYGSDGETVSYKEIQTFFNGANCTRLLGKPKLFFIQACQGKEKDKGKEYDDVDGGPAEPGPSKQVTVQESVEQADEVDGPEHIPIMADMFLGKATTPEFVSWRNQSKGTWYIYAIVRIFSKYAALEALNDMHDRINNYVSHSKTSTGFKQVSSYDTTLRKKFFFFPGKST